MTLQNGRGMWFNLKNGVLVHLAIIYRRIPPKRMIQATQNMYPFLMAHEEGHMYVKVAGVIN